MRNKEKRGKVMTMFLSCEVGNGVFDLERSVIIEDYQGNTRTFFVDKNAVKVEKPPMDNKVVRGFVEVVFIEKKKDRALVNVPSEGEDSIITVSFERLTKPDDIK